MLNLSRQHSILSRQPGMPSTDYTTAGGALKLKGGSGIDKKRKKKKPKQPDAAETNPSSTGDGAPRQTSKEKDMQTVLAEEDAAAASASESGSVGARPEAVGEAAKKDMRDQHKTEAERKHEERRRKRLDERLRREGIKTHKERVQELNRYLSNLSEHHDM